MIIPSRYFHVEPKEDVLPVICIKAIAAFVAAAPIVASDVAKRRLRLILRLRLMLSLAMMSIGKRTNVKSEILQRTVKWAIPVSHRLCD